MIIVAIRTVFYMFRRLEERWNILVYIWNFHIQYKGTIYTLIRYKNSKSNF